MGTTLLIATRTCKTVLQQKATLALTLLLGLTLCLATWIGWEHFKMQQQQRQQYAEIVRKQWVSKPDKHPHRMAHYGYLVFRDKHPLSFFDFGIESFSGVSIFLEAHKQNTVNFSEAGFSNGTLRFGEMNVAMVLQLLVPLLIFFLGYNAIAAERENGTLKILLCQGVSWRQLLTGKTLGIIGISFILFIPVMLLTMLLWAMLSHWQVTADAAQRLLLLLLGYTVYFIICAGVAVLVSAFSRTSRGALTTLLGCWIFFLVILPRLTQAAGTRLYPSPSKMEFAAAIEADLHKEGDSHNPDDPHYAKLKAALLKQYQVDDVKQLPFNYSGYVMAEGEKISAGIYSQHQKKLTAIYQQQNSFTIAAGFVNPYLAIRHLSMALTTADFDTYAGFQEQAEVYRYQLAQRMNSLQMKYISNETPATTDKPAAISHSHWEEMPDFRYRFKPVAAVVYMQLPTIAALLYWLGLVLIGLQVAAKFVKTL
jgi:ABC-2 type transport system permease protein